MFRRSLALAAALSLPAVAQTAARPGSPLVSPSAAGRLVVMYRSGAVPANAESFARSMGARAEHSLQHLGASVVTVEPGQQAPLAARLRMRPEVESVLEDRYVEGHAMLVRPATGVRVGIDQNEAQPLPVAKLPSLVRISAPHTGLVSLPGAPDSSYASATGWAVQAAGGFGDGIPGGAAVGPWNVSLGAGVRIAILDSGIDTHHPDLAPNVAVNLSEVDQTALPSACDDGSPQDQQGHGTWAASLAAGALGSSTGETIGVAPQATLLNIKVLQRMPATASGTLTAQCEAGQTGGLLSWVLTGINDAIAQHANVISLSLGSLVDLTTGDGAGWKASFDRVTYAATQAGVVIVAAVGNDGLDLSSGRYAELPAQARGVLAVTASTNPSCAENLVGGAACAPGPVTRAYYSNHGIADAIAAPGGSYPEGPDGAGATSGWIRAACSQGVPNTLDGLPASGASFGCFGLGHVPYVQAMGTSASAPLVAGAAALLHAAHPGWTAAQVVGALRSTATTLPTMAEPEINLPAALQAQ